jgi:hypothetical protein
MRRLLKRHSSGDLIERIAADDQLARQPVHMAEASLGGDHAFQATGRAIGRAGHDGVLS